VLLYFAGHGSPEADAQTVTTGRYLILHDTDHRYIHTTGIDMDCELQTWFDRLHSPRLVLLLLDACFSGRAGGRTFEGPVLRRQRSLHRGVSPISLANLDLGEGRILMAACRDDEVAGEDTLLRHGVFTYYLLQRFHARPGDAPTLGIGSLYEEVASNVRAYTTNQQRPILKGRLDGGRVPLLPLPA
jgi:uncharacterized caspase-like protein